MFLIHNFRAFPKKFKKKRNDLVVGTVIEFFLFFRRTRIGMEHKLNKMDLKFASVTKKVY